jgi:5'-deoxynucleotidase YfbR-like HD superfamily hydrolase
MTDYPKVAEINVETGETIIREKTDEEKAVYDADQVALAAQEQAKIAEATTKAALLARLGITAEEAKLLLGGN